MQTIERKDGITFWKWDEPGQSLDVVITEDAVLGRPNDFGGEDYHFRGVITGTEDRVQVPMPYDLRKKFEQVMGAVVLGQTRFLIEYTGTRPIKGRSPMKLFNVQVDGLKE